MALEEYKRKRDFSRTPEPSGDAAESPWGTASAWDALPHGRRFCVQKHRATRMHLDFRLEHNGVLLSWAIPRGPTLDPAKKRLSVQTEDHPIDYGSFEGVIPSGYGAGVVMLWDIGTFEWVKESADDFEKSRARGDLKFRLQGSKICGEFALVHIGERGRTYGGSTDSDKNWLMIKKKDECARAGFEALDLDYSVVTGRTLAEIAAAGGGDPRDRSRRDNPPAPRPAAEKPPDPPRPMLATPIDSAFSREGWLFELKYDGVRALVSVAGSAIRIVGRSGREETPRYPEASSIRAAITPRQAILDGELVVLDDEGRPSFERLQSRINVTRPQDVERVAREHPVTYVVFDLLNLDGRDIMKTDLRIRKKTLRENVRDTGSLIFADHVEREGETLFEQARSSGVEGIVGKKADSRYQPGVRSRDWVKVKSWLTQTCVIIGFTQGRGKRSGSIGALILAVREGDRLVHCGQVGTGFDEETLRALRERLQPLVSDRSPVEPEPKTMEPATWVRPELVCEVRFSEWTSAGVLRHPAFLGLRNDVTVSDAVRERIHRTAAVVPGPSPPAKKNSPRTPPREPETSDAVATPDDIESSLKQLRRLRADDRWEVAGRTLSLSNLDKVLWPGDGITKRDMIAYYVRMAPYLLPYLRDRPLSMQVFPDGITGKSFWRKDKPSYAPQWMASWTYHGEKTKTYIVVNETATLGWVANAGVIDLHPWHSRIDAPDKPDWAVFDLDPFEPATFADVVHIAKLVKAALDHYGMHGVIKTSGQTGLQIYVPLRRGSDYDTVRGWVEAVGRAIGKVEPQKITWEWTVAYRAGKIRIDYTQNIINKTLAAPYSLRPAPRAPVSTPIAWEELDDRKLRPDRWTIATIGRRVAEVGDLFIGVLAGDQDLPSAV